RPIWNINMLDPKLLRTETDTIAAQLAQRGFPLDVSLLTQLEAERKAAQLEAQELQTQRNARSKTIGKAKAAGEDIAPLLAEIDDLGERHKAAEARLAAVLEKINDVAMGTPNLPQHDVPPGNDENDNVEVLRWGKLRQFDFEP